MEIWHRISFNSSGKEIFHNEIRSLGIKYQAVDLPGSGGILISFDISESDSNWDFVSKMARTWDAVDIYETFFSNDEIRAAEWSRLIPTNIIGYPQPESLWSREHYNYSEYCNNCGTHSQKDQYVIKPNLRLKKKSFGTLHWTYAVLCNEIVCDEFRNLGFLGFECWNVLTHKSNESSGIFQIITSTVLGPSLAESESLDSRECSECRIIKYAPHTRGIMKLRRQGLNIKKTDFAQTFEWFGTGKSAYRELLISNQVARVILDRAWQGVRLKAVEIV